MPTPHPPDAELRTLIDRIAARDTTAMKALYDRVARKLYGLALRVLGNAQWAEDALQDAMLPVWRTAGDYRASLSPPMAWLSLIARSRALDQLRRRRAEREHLRDDIDDARAVELVSDEAGPLDSSLASQQAKALHQCLMRLEARQRELINLAYLRELSHSELAQQLKMPLGTVKSLVRRGMEQLRICMARFA